MTLRHGIMSCALRSETPSCFCRWTAAADSESVYRENMQHIRSGDLCEVAQVIKSLSVRDHARGLSTGEKKMLEQAMQILESELAFALDRPAERIAEMLREHLCR